MSRTAALRFRAVVWLFAFAPFIWIATPAAYGAPLTFVAHLSGLNENPPNASPAMGTAVVTLDPTAHTLQLNVTFSNLTANDTAAHIHCCLSSPFAPDNVGVATR